MNIKKTHSTETTPGGMEIIVLDCAHHVLLLSCHILLVLSHGPAGKPCARTYGRKNVRTAAEKSLKFHAQSSAWGLFFMERGPSNHEKDEGEKMKKKKIKKRRSPVQLPALCTHSNDGIYHLLIARTSSSLSQKGKREMNEQKTRTERQKEKEKATSY